MQVELDAKDLEILRILEEEGRRSTNDIAEQIRLSPSATSRRIARLESDGIIEGYSVKLDLKKLGYHLTVMVEISLSSQSDEALTAFEAAIKQVSAVRSCYLMSGRADYLLTVVAKGLPDFEVLHRKVLPSLPHVDRMHTAFAIRDVMAASAESIETPAFF